MRYQYDNYEKLRIHLEDFIAAYNLARRLKTLNGLTRYEYICKICSSEAEKLIINPIHQMPGLNTYNTNDVILHANLSINFVDP